MKSRVFFNVSLMFNTYTSVYYIIKNVERAIMKGRTSNIERLKQQQAKRPRTAEEKTPEEIESEKIRNTVKNLEDGSREEQAAYLKKLSATNPAQAKQLEEHFAIIHQLKTIRDAVEARKQNPEEQVEIARPALPKSIRNDLQKFASRVDALADAEYEVRQGKFLIKNVADHVAYTRKLREAEQLENEKQAKRIEEEKVAEAKRLKEEEEFRRAEAKLERAVIEEVNNVLATEEAYSEAVRKEVERQIDEEKQCAIEEMKQRLAEEQRLLQEQAAQRLAEEQQRAEQERLRREYEAAQKQKESEKPFVVKETGEIVNKRTGVNSKEKRELYQKLYAEQVAKRRVRTALVVIAAIVFTPLSLLISLPLWFRAKRNEPIKKVEDTISNFREVKNKKRAWRDDQHQTHKDRLECTSDKKIVRYMDAHKFKEHMEFKNQTLEHLNDHKTPSARDKRKLLSNSFFAEAKAKAAEQQAKAKVIAAEQQAKARVKAAEPEAKKLIKHYRELEEKNNGPTYLGL